MTLTTLAGIPATKLLGGTSFVTTAPAAITEPSPIVTPGVTTTLPPIHILFPIVIGSANSNLYYVLDASMDGALYKIHTMDL